MKAIVEVAILNSDNTWYSHEVTVLGANWRECTTNAEWEVIRMLSNGNPKLPDGIVGVSAIHGDLSDG